MAKEKKKIEFKKVFPWLLVVVGVLGLLASFMISLEKIAILKDPAHQALCSINPVFSCNSIIKSDQASVFGFPNPFIGLIAYAMLLTTGIGMLAGATFKRWYWKAFMLGPLGGLLFVHWLIHESLYDIGALCLYCMLAWSVTIPAFVYTLLWNLREGNIVPPKALRGAARFFDRHHFDILVVWYLLIIFAILNRFWYYFGG